MKRLDAGLTSILDVGSSGAQGLFVLLDGANSEVWRTNGTEANGPGPLQRRVDARAGHGAVAIPDLPGGFRRHAVTMTDSRSASSSPGTH
ncbi:hypothetical protein HJC22_33505 [Corallococcus exiguus]|uniref:hypothetical protein n=1 Tax=Corallococcus TaxID=83461 RepID=UPI0014719631|nr:MULTISPECIES: hypothetical protein [Corallococcus]NNC20649.1 hypothetical protein [Corallococcus exiguus]